VVLQLPLLQGSYLSALLPTELGKISKVVRVIFVLIKLCHLIYFYLTWSASTEIIQTNLPSFTFLLPVCPFFFWHWQFCYLNI
jgi:hypothetical protein